MKQLVTGGAGFIGSNYIYYMQKKHPNYSIFCLDNLTYAGNLNTLRDAYSNGNFKFFEGDISDRDFVFTLFEKEKFDVVVNFAAESHVDRSIKNPSVFLNTNILGTQVLMDACRKIGVKKFHQVSTDEVYGDLPLDRPDLLFTEKTSISASSPYSASKAAADFLVMAYARTYALPVTISRCSNNYGPNQFPEKLIPLMIINALDNKPLPLYGDGKNVRDWLYVEDHCAAIDLIIHQSKNGEIYNIGANNERTNMDMAKIILKELGKSQELIKYIPDRAGHDLRYAVDSSKLRNDLGWKPKTTFNQGIFNTVRWYCMNESWWKDIFSGEYKKDINWMENMK